MWQMFSLFFSRDRACTKKINNFVISRMSRAKEKYNHIFNKKHMKKVVFRFNML